MKDKSKKRQQIEKQLGMGRKITRRDFLNGVAAGTGSALLTATGATTVFGAETLLAAGAFDELPAQNSAGYYPPAKIGMRGQSRWHLHLRAPDARWRKVGRLRQSSHQR